MTAVAEFVSKKKFRRMRGFERTSALLAQRVRKGGESRGFAVSRLLTHWAEVVGTDLAAMARPVEISYGREGFGGTLTLLTTGAQAPLLEMQSATIREKVNACYGYAAIARIRITQIAATGFAEGRVDFDHAPRLETGARGPSSEARQAAGKLAAPVRDDGLRAALETLGGHVLSARTDISNKGPKR